MLADILLIIVALVALVIAALSDIKIKEVPDFASIGLIAVALAIRFFHSAIFNEWSYFIYGLIGFGAMFLVGALIYYTKQWGGGDAKLLMGLGAAFATRPFYLEPISPKLPFLLHLLTNVFVMGAAFGLIAVLIIFIRRRKAITKEFSSMVIRLKKKLATILIIIFIIFLIVILLNQPYRFAILILLFAITLYLILYLFIKSVEKVGMYKQYPVKRLVEGDWVAEDIKIRNKKIYDKRSLGITRKQIEALKKAKIKEVLIKDGMIFVPSIFVGTVLTLTVGNVLIWLL